MFVLPAKKAPTFLEPRAREGQEITFWSPGPWGAALDQRRPVHKTEQPNAYIQGLIRILYIGKSRWGCWGGLLEI